MNTTGWIILIVVVVIVVIAIVVVALTAGRRRKLEHDRQQAGELRAAAGSDDLAAREREAKAARAEADAKQAEVEAEQRRREAAAHAAEAGEARSAVDDKLARADRLDPDVRTDRQGNRLDGPDEAAGRHAEPRIDGPAARADDEVPPPRPATDR